MAETAMGDQEVRWAAQMVAAAMVEEQPAAALLAVATRGASMEAADPAVAQVAMMGERKEAGPMEARMEEARAAAEGLTVTAAMEVMAPLEETCS